MNVKALSKITSGVNMKALTQRAAGATQLYLKRNGPTILTGVGIAGFAATTYLTGRAVLRAQDKVKKLKVNHRALMSDQKITDKERASELGVLWAHDGALILKDFAPAIVTGSLSIACIISSHGMMKNRETSLVAAYTALDAGYRAYRKRVQAELGEEKERELYRGPIPPCSSDAEGEERDDGLVDWQSVLPSPYTRFFDESNKHWTPSPERNLFFLRRAQDYANDRLRAYGHLFLNEVLDDLGMERSEAGQELGWTLEHQRSEEGDGFVDFGLYAEGSPSMRAFINCMEPSVMLEFNCDGPILRRAGLRKA
jgi:Family of unknown function (DUF6353)